MSCNVIFLIVVTVCTLSSQNALADEGPLKKDPPVGITAEEIIQRFTAKEKEFKKVRDTYGYRQTVKAQTLDGDTVTGEYQQVFDVSLDDKGYRLKNVVFSPQPSINTIT